MDKLLEQQLKELTEFQKKVYQLGWKAREKEKSDRYYAQEALDDKLRSALTETRMEPGLSIRNIANIIKKVFQPEEIKSLIRFLTGSPKGGLD